MTYQSRGATAGRAEWTASEVERFRAAYAAGGIAAARAALPGRTDPALFKKARALGIRRYGTRWDAAKLARLRKLWNADMSIEEIAAALGSTPKSVYWYSRQLNLPTVPEGWEYLTHAATRCGYDPGQLRVILAAAGVELRRVHARPSPRRGRRRGKRNAFHMVWPPDVDQAVADWLQRETARDAAKRLGVSEEFVAKRLRAVGVRKPGRKRKAAWRATAGDLERALGARVVRLRGERGRFSGARLVAGGTA